MNVAKCGRSFVTDVKKAAGLVFARMTYSPSSEKSNEALGQIPHLWSGSAHLEIRVARACDPQHTR